MNPEEVYEYCFDIVTEIYENTYFEPETGLIMDLVNIRKLIEYIHKNMPGFFERYNRDYTVPIVVLLAYYNAIGFPLRPAFFGNFIGNSSAIKSVYGDLEQRIDFKALGIKQPKDLVKAYLKNIKKTLINFFVAWGHEEELTMVYFEFLFSLVEKILPEFLHRTECWTDTVILAIVHRLTKGLSEVKFHCSDMFMVTQDIIRTVFHVTPRNLYDTGVLKNLSIDFEVPVLKIRYNDKLLVVNQVDETLVKRDLVHKIQNFFDNKKQRLDKKLELLDFIIKVLRFSEENNIDLIDEELVETLDNFIKVMERSTNKEAIVKTKELKQIYQQILEKRCLTKVLI